jgi:hypothetical protein
MLSTLGSIVMLSGLGGRRPQYPFRFLPEPGDEISRTQIIGNSMIVVVILAAFGVLLLLLLPIGIRWLMSSFHFFG